MKQVYNLDDIENNVEQKSSKPMEKQATFSLSNHSISSKSSTSSISSMDSGVFTICNPSKLKAIIPMSQTIQATQPLTYTRHSNLDVRPLSFKERCHLARLRYLNIGNVIRLVAITFCLAVFSYIAKTTLKEFLHHGTIVHLDYRSPNITMPPAITVCSSCVLCE